MLTSSLVPNQVKGLRLDMLKPEQAPSRRSADVAAMSGLFMAVPCRVDPRVAETIGQEKPYGTGAGPSDSAALGEPKHQETRRGQPRLRRNRRNFRVPR